jgi:predicted transposase YdaD
MAGTFDATLKQLLDACAPDWVTWLAPLVGLPASVAADPLDVDLSTVQPVADKVFRLRSPATGLLHLEAQSSWDGEFPNRLLLYNVLLHGRYGGPVHTVALLLRREAMTSDLTGTVVRHDTAGTEYLRFRYTAVRVWELAADTLLKGKLGASPLALLTDDAETRLPKLVNQFTDRVVRESQTTADANLLLSCGYILLGLRYDDVLAATLFEGVQKMQESSTYQAIRREGRVEGRDEGMLLARQEDLLALLQERFGAVPPEVEAKVRATTDVVKLQTALRRVIHINAPSELPLD